MLVKEIMERVGITETGRAIAYIKDGLEEMNLISSENIVTGDKRSITSNGISINGGEVFDAATKAWDGASDDSYSATPPTNWTLYENDAGHADPHFNNITSDGSLRIKNKFESDIGDYMGIQRSFTVISGARYNFQASLSRGDHPSSSADRARIDIRDTTSGSIITSKYTTGTIDVNITFTATSASVTIYIYYQNMDDGLMELTNDEKYISVNNISLSTGINIMNDSNNLLGVFEPGDKITVNNSKFNDSDKSANTSIGYYTVSSASAGQILIEDEFGSTETAGNSITVSSSPSNYMDIIKDKRYYNIPSEAIRLTDIKIKNHLNTDDQWRSIPRMIGKPLNTDKDEI